MLKLSRIGITLDTNKTSFADVLKLFHQPELFKEEIRQLVIKTQIPSTEVEYQVNDIHKKFIRGLAKSMKSALKADGT